MEAVNNGGIRGSCAICQNNLSMNEKVSALLCGHTFHFSCVAQWLQVKSVCPNCRKKVNSKNGLIDKLYFDVLDTDATSTSSEAISDAERADKLVEDLLKIRMEKAEKDKLCEELQKEVKALEKKVIREKERFKKEIPALKARNQHLEMMESDYEATVKELHQANAKLKASEFYRILFEKHAEGVDQAMQKFLKDNGELEMETFFQTMKKQNNSLKIEKNEAVKEAERLRNELRPMKKEINEKINIIQALRKEIDDLRKMADTNTPINKRLRSILMNPETPVDSSQKRKSMGFDETNRLIQSDELSFFEEEKRKKRKIENATNLDETFIEEKLRRNKKIGKNLNFDEEEEEEENDEDFDDSPIFKKFTKKKMTKNAENAENEKEEKCEMIDVHCHLADNKFKTDVDLVIAEAQSMGVEKMVAVAEFPSQFETIIELVSKHQGVVYGGIGVHPIQKRNKSVKLKHLDEIETFLTNHHQNSGIVCVGEIGIDHTEDQFKLTPADLVVQEEVFRRQIQMARHFQLPINVHSRSAAKRTIEILNSEDVGNSSQVILHAFDGNIEDARNALNHDYFFSIPPSFRGSQRAAQIIDEIPLSQILLETDAPALGPHKGQRNEPKNLRICAEIVAEIKNEKIDKIIESTTKNAKKLFKI